MFLWRAHAIDARFSFDERSIQLTGMVCRRLDGIPLTIELAAACAEILGIETLAGHLDDRFDMLTGGKRTALPRHQTLKATLDRTQLLYSACTRVAEGLDWDGYQAAASLLQITGQACGQNVMAAAIVRSAAEPASDHGAPALSGKVSERG